MLSRSLGVLAGALLLTQVPLGAQTPTLTCDDAWDDDEERYCEIREVTLAAGRSPITIDGGPNGGVRVRGWDRNEIRVVTRIEAHARSEARARELAAGVRIESADAIRSSGPETGRREWWSVSFEAFVPRQSDLALETLNGGIRVADVHGRIRFDVTNGGVSLKGLGGDVSGRSTNGGIHVDLDGTTWDGTGLDVRTTNGGVRLSVPEGYSARLETGTTNGGLQFEFPVTVQGRLNRQVEVDLGGGGPRIRVMTTNGGVIVRRPEI
jgi:hypothetical protein